MSTNKLPKSFDRIFEFMWQDDDPVKRLLQLPEAECNAWRVIDLLSDRKGFSWWWWEQIEPSCRTEIFWALVRVFKGRKGGICKTNKS